MKLIFSHLSLLLIICSFNLQAQDLKDADNLYKNGNYAGALEAYQVLLKADQNNLDLNYKMGVCYLNTNIDKGKAVQYFEKISDNSEANPNTQYLLARAYQYAYEFDKAIAMYTTVKEKGVGNEDNLASIDKQIDYCQNAIEYMKFPVNVDIVNLGDQVNSPYPDYYPFTPIDESYIIFNSKRQVGVELPDGSFTADVYMSKVVDGKYTKARRLGEEINTEEYSEEVAGLKADGSQAIFYIENPDGTGDLHVSNIKNGQVYEPKKLTKKINSKYTEIAATIAADGKSIYFASNMPGGKGGTDIYVSRILPNGKWGPAQNLGATINTEFDEDFPNISPDGKTLYFSSKGHTSMGGYDIFKATWDPVKRKFGSVSNLRFPINTPDDDMNFIVSETGRYGYMSSVRGDSYGNLDIYRVTFNEVEPRFTVITGVVKGPDGENIPADDVYLAIIDKSSDEVYGDYKPNAKSSRYVMILPPGKYELTLEVNGYAFHAEDIEILDKTGYKGHIQKDITLKK